MSLNAFLIFFLIIMMDNWIIVETGLCKKINQSTLNVNWMRENGEAKEKTSHKTTVRQQLSTKYKK